MNTPSDGRMPVLFLPHGGGPLPLLGDPNHARLVRFLSAIGAELGRPVAVLVVSAHWEAPVPTLTGAAMPGLIYDYSGFPPESYRIEYPVPGDPVLAEAIAARLETAGFRARVDDQRGLDHGLFVPLKLIYPEATIPCLQLSLVAGLDPAVHVALGRALSGLRLAGVLIVGSGLSFHNMRAFLDPALGRRVEEGAQFDRWLREVCAGSGLGAVERERMLIEWERAPHARYCHPREEHLLPLHVCFGAAGGKAAEVVFNEPLLGQQVSGLLWR